MPVTLFGDWDKIPQVLTLASRFQKSVDRALLREGERLRKGIVTGIASGAPGGQQLAPLSPITIAVRRMKGFGGSKPLIVTGTMRGNVVVHKAAHGAVFVGLLRQAQAKGGGSLANIGEIHEFGRDFQRKMTRKQYRFLFAAIRRAGLSGPIGPRMKSGAFRSQAGTVHVRIPARPFVGPVFEKERGSIVKRFWEAVAKGMGYDLGRPR